MHAQRELFNNDSSTVSAMLSAFTKSIRLRRRDDAAFWLTRLWYSPHPIRHRAQRRLLISSGEDCQNLHVMADVSNWFNSQCRFDLTAAVVEVIRICKTPNWYARPEGRVYIRRWFESERRCQEHCELSASRLLETIGVSVRAGSAETALDAFTYFYRSQRSNRRDLGRMLMRYALERDNGHAAAIAELFESNTSQLWNDGNFSGQSLYALFYGPAGPQCAVVVDQEEAVQLIANVSERLGRDVQAPSWALDGIHTGGNDDRFAGRIDRMAAACDVYEALGRLDVDDDWAQLGIVRNHG